MQRDDSEGNTRAALHTTDVPRADGGRVITIETVAYSDIEYAPKLSPAEEFDKKLDALLRLTGMRYDNINIAYGVIGFNRKPARESRGKSYSAKEAKERVISSVNCNFRLQPRQPSDHHVNRITDQEESGYLSGNLDVARLASDLDGYMFGIELVLYGCDLTHARQRCQELSERVRRYNLEITCGWSLYAGNRESMERRARGDLRRAAQQRASA
jgi:hypothetical protein